MSFSSAFGRSSAVSVPAGRAALSFSSSLALRFTLASSASAASRAFASASVLTSKASGE
ncbi:hypothetical protein LILAB_36645 [Corallococcus macrosporus]|uniref:Uncharacterized protein n=1 Tax=Myxococcus fulvus (strain ATCC BAA-855 / HW-1) TaxID=483219 RepID=F8CPR4_MYXFH|nr:hypothetical protein LILAB_36645 [Corallococcus macrosporus]